MQSIYDLNMKMATEMLAEKGQKSYRAKHYSNGFIVSVWFIQEMTDMPASLLEELAQEYSIDLLRKLHVRLLKMELPNIFSS